MFSQILIRKIQSLCERTDNVCNSNQIDISETPEEKRKRIAMLEDDPEQWFQYYFPKYAYAEPADFHKAATKRVIDNQEWYEVRMWSRELAKSTRTMMEVLYITLAGHKIAVTNDNANAPTNDQAQAPAQEQTTPTSRAVACYGSTRAGDQAQTPAQEQTTDIPACYGSPRAGDQTPIAAPDNTQPADVKPKTVRKKPTVKKVKEKNIASPIPDNSEGKNDAEIKPKRLRKKAIPKAKDVPTADVIEACESAIKPPATRARKQNVLLISSSFDNAQRLLLPYKANLEANNRLINDYGIQHKPGSWEASEFITRSGISFRAIGAGQSPRGSRNEEIRPDVILFDDLDTDEDCRNPELIKKKWKWIEEAAMSTRSISKATTVIFCGNKIGADCCVSRAAQFADHAEAINIRDGNGASTWPVKNTEAYIDRVLSICSTISLRSILYNIFFIGIVSFYLIIQI